MSTTYYQSDDTDESHSPQSHQEREPPVSSDHNFAPRRQRLTAAAEPEDNCKNPSMHIDEEKLRKLIEKLRQDEDTKECAKEYLITGGYILMN